MSERSKCPECGGSQVIEVGLPDIYGSCPTCASDPVSRVEAIEAAEDRAEQAAFDAARERGL